MGTATVDHLEQLVTMELDPQGVRDRLKQLSKKDSKRKVFGAASHEYVLNPPLSADELEAFESEHGITLPGRLHVVGPRFFLEGVEHDFLAGGGDAEPLDDLAADSQLAPIRVPTRPECRLRIPISVFRWSFPGC